MDVDTPPGSQVEILWLDSDEEPETPEVQVRRMRQTIEKLQRTIEELQQTIKDSRPQRQE